MKPPLDSATQFPLRFGHSGDWLKLSSISDLLSLSIYKNCYPDFLKESNNLEMFFLTVQIENLPYFYFRFI